jgi:hypothetical protein
MGAKAKVIALVLLIIIVILAVWQFTSPTMLPIVGTKYSANPAYANRGSWTIKQNMSYASAFLSFSIANLTYPKTTLPTEYSLVISNMNQTLTSSIVKGLGVRVTMLSIIDNYDGSTSKWGIAMNLTDAVQATGIFNFRTSTTHMLRVTVSYQLYDLLIIGSIPDKTITQSFNITQSVL